MAQTRTDLANERTGFSGYRSVLAKGRTELAFIRTGLALVALGTGLLRGFGVGGWTIFDVGIIVIGTLMTFFGTKGYFVTRKYERILAAQLNSFLTLTATMASAQGK